jgi:hypothetical protein
VASATLHHRAAGLPDPQLVWRRITDLHEFTENPVSSPIIISAAMSQMSLNAARTLVFVFTALVGGVIPVWAQQSEPSSASLDRIRAALQSPQPITIASDGVPLFAPSKPDEFPDEFSLGVLRFVRPETPGLFVEIRVPVGALVSRAAHSIAATQHRRAENAARDEVVKALAEFQRAQPK